MENTAGKLCGKGQEKSPVQKRAGLTVLKSSKVVMRVLEDDFEAVIYGSGVWEDLLGLVLESVGVVISA